MIHVRIFCYGFRGDHCTIEAVLPIETPSLLLRHFVLDDAAAALLLSNEETSRTWLPSQVYQDKAHARSALSFLIGQYSTPGDPKYGPYVLAIEHRVDAVLIGHVGFSPLDDDVEIGFSIARDYQRRGLATEALLAASRWALQTFELDRIIAIASTANIASKRALERARFVFQEDRAMNFQGTQQEVSVYSFPS
jgi:RimJ/RimL family protein N-acetyltransferase